MRYIKLLLTAAALLASVTVVTAQDKAAKKKGGPGLAPLLQISIADFADGSRIPE